MSGPHFRFGKRRKCFPAFRGSPGKLPGIKRNYLKFPEQVLRGSYASCSGPIFVRVCRPLDNPGVALRCKYLILGNAVFDIGFKRSWYALKILYF